MQFTSRVGSVDVPRDMVDRLRKRRITGADRDKIEGKQADHRSEHWYSIFDQAGSDDDTAPLS